MHRLLFAALVLASVLPLSAKPLGIGIIVGEPTGLCIKAPQAGRGSVVLAAAWSFSDYMHLHADYIVDNTTLIEDYDLVVYYGLGCRLLMGNNNRVGIRVPVGLNYRIAGSPLDCFFELAPLLDLVPSTGFYPNAAVGLRFFFN